MRPWSARSQVQVQGSACWRRGPSRLATRLMAPGLTPLLMCALALAIVEARRVDSLTVWSGPRVRPVFNSQGLSALEIDGVLSAPGVLVGNTQGGLVDNWADWAVELESAGSAGVRIFGICPSGTDLGPVVQLSAHTRSMIDMVLKSVPDALIIPRIPVGGAPESTSAVVMMATNGTLTSIGYGSMTSNWTAGAAPRMAQLLQLMDAAYPGKIAGVHLAGLAAGEMRYECPPEGVPGYADYSAGMQADYCTEKERRSGAAQHACVVPTAAERCAAQTGNSLFVDASVADFNLFQSRKVQESISAHAAAAKAAMGGKGLVWAFYGYLNELGGLRTAAGGQLALAQLLRDPNVDGIVSPYKYDELYRLPSGPFVTMGTADSCSLHNKMWISEDDTRTSFSGAKPGGLAFACAANDTACDEHVLRRNTLTSVLHGSGLYQFDLPMAGWFGGQGAKAAATASLWAAVGGARRAAEKLFGLEGELQPEVAIFLDDVSLGHVIAADWSGPVDWLNDLPAQVAAIGAPVRHFHLRDLLDPTAAAARAVQAIKLAVLPNAFALSDELRAAIARFAVNRTLLYYYAPGVLDAGGQVDWGGVVRQVGAPLVRGTGNRSVTSEFVVPASASAGALPLPPPRGCPDMSVLAGERYGPTMSGQPLAGTLDPWGYLDEQDTEATARCSVMARYADADAGGAKGVSGFCADQGDHTVVFSSAPLPSAALRLVARAAGVHLFLNTTAAGTTGTACSGDGVEAAGAGLLLRGGPHASSSAPQPVSLPPRPLGWNVTDEDGGSGKKRSGAEQRDRDD